MRGLFQRGDRLPTEFSQTDCIIERYIDAGTQGEVYVAQLAGEECAVKWYFPHSGTPNQKAIIEQLIRRESPDKTRFLWPSDIVSSAKAGLGSFGYVMQLRPNRFVSIPRWLDRDCSPTFWSLLTAALNIVEAFQALHTAGFVYRDISDNNIFFDAATGDALICDNDNVGIRGERMFNIIGTTGFMAQEVAKGLTDPTVESDLYSLSVLLFKLLMVHHPLIGKRVEQIRALDDAATRWIYVDNPVFIYDPADRSNEPDPMYHRNAIVFWKLYPEILRDCFVRAFANGIKNPAKRIWEPEWKKVLSGVRDSIFPCLHCDEDNFFDVKIMAKLGNPGPCRNCRQLLVPPPRLRIGDNPPVMLHKRTRLYASHLSLNEAAYPGPVAEVVQHPKDPRRLGLRNLSINTWRVGEQPSREIPPQGAFGIQGGLKIEFSARVKGEIRW